MRRVDNTAIMVYLSGVPGGKLEGDPLDRRMKVALFDRRKSGYYGSNLLRGNSLMIIGAHSIIYSRNPEVDRAFLRDVSELLNDDSGNCTRRY